MYRSQEKGFLGCFAGPCIFWWTSERVGGQCRLSSVLTVAEAGAPRGLNSRNLSLCLGVLGSWHAWLFCPQKRLWFGRQILKALLLLGTVQSALLPPPLPRLIWGAGRWLQATAPGRFGKPLRWGPWQNAAVDKADFWSTVGLAKTLRFPRVQWSRL